MLLLFARRQNSPARSITTRGEISWFAYNMPTIELHNELFSQLQELYGQTSISAVDGDIKKSFGEMNEQPRLYIWIKKTKQGDVSEPNRTLAYCVRNAIHHPENHSMGQGFVEEHLEESISDILRSRDQASSRKVSTNDLIALQDMEPGDYGCSEKRATAAGYMPDPGSSSRRARK